MAEVWQSSGLEGCRETSLMIRMEFGSFEDYWGPFATGEGPHGKYVVGLPERDRENSKRHVPRA